MALIRKLEKISKDRSSVHRPVVCGYTVVAIGSQRYLQLETYGSPSRKLQGKISQVIQFDRCAAEQLRKILGEAFPD